MGSKLIDVNNLKISGRIGGKYNHTIVDNISFSLIKGETLGIVGESGSGKSILVRAIMNFLPSSCKIENGHILFEDKDLTKLDKNELKKIRGFQIAMISDNPLETLDPIFSVKKQVIETMLTYNQTMSKQEAHDKVLDIFTTLKMPDPEKMLNSFPYQLSGGMQQRVTIALALCGNVKLLIADDATRSLDVTIAAQIVELLRKMKEQSKLSMIWISANLSMCSILADKIMIMYKGKIIEMGSKEEILVNPKHSYTKMLLEVKPSLHEEKKENEFHLAK